METIDVKAASAVVEEFRELVRVVRIDDVNDIDHYIPHITIDSLGCRDGRINRWDGGDDEPTVPAENDERPTFHKDDHGDRTNQKLRVQPFYQRGRDGKPKKW